MTNIPSYYLLSLPYIPKNLFSTFLKTALGLSNIRNIEASSSPWHSSTRSNFSVAMTSHKKLEVRLEDHSTLKWCVPLKEDSFVTFMEKGNATVHKIFGEGSLFSPLLFGNFFDPSDAFPLWEFESDVLLSNLHSSRQSTVDWSQTDADYVLKAELPDAGKNSILVCIEDGKVLEINGQWRQQKDSRTKDWRASHWWEHGYVRRIELPENADWRNIEAYVNNDILLDIRIPKKPPVSDAPGGNT